MPKRIAVPKVSMINKIFLSTKMLSLTQCTITSLIKNKALHNETVKKIFLPWDGFLFAMMQTYAQEKKHIKNSHKAKNRIVVVLKF